MVLESNRDLAMAKISYNSNNKESDEETTE